MNQEGLYRIVDKTNKRSFQTLIYKDDSWELFKSLCKIFVYGYSDDNLRLDEWTSKAVFRNMLMQCGPTAVSCYKLLNSLGIKTRVVACSGSANFGNTGHVFNEVFLDGNWVIMDFTKKIVVTDKEGNLLSLLQVINKGGFAECVLTSICKEHIQVDCGIATQIGVNGYFGNDSFESVFFSLDYPQNLKKWFDVFDVYLCSENPVYEMYVLTSEDLTYNDKLYKYYKAENYYHFLPYRDFVSKFYGES